MDKKVSRSARNDKRRWICKLATKAENIAANFNTRKTYCQSFLSLIVSHSQIFVNKCLRRIVKSLKNCWKTQLISIFYERQLIEKTILRKDKASKGQFIENTIFEKTNFRLDNFRKDKLSNRQFFEKTKFRTDNSSKGQFFDR